MDINTCNHYRRIGYSGVAVSKKPRFPAGRYRGYYYPEVYGDLGVYLFVDGWGTQHLQRLFVAKLAYILSYEIEE